MRTCIGCRRVAPAAQLVRVVRVADGSLAVGRTAPGRGAWLCSGTPADLPAVSCLDLAARRRAFGRAFRSPVEQSRIAVLREMVRERARIEGRGVVPVAANRRD